MTRRPATPLPTPVPLALKQPRTETAGKLQERIDTGEELRVRQVRSTQEAKAYMHDATAWSDYNEELLRRLFTNDSISQEFRMGGGPVSGQYDHSNMHELYRETTENHIGILRSILGRLDLFPEAAAIIRDPTQQRDLSKVFVVHGHDDGAKHAVARFLEKIDLEAIVLQEQPDQGFTIIEKFESYAGQVGFAVVLLTPDDLAGSVSSSAQTMRARQNVIFELGYFTGKLGRGRACLLRKGDVEMPSDLYGVIYKEMDPGGGWKLQLAQEMKAAGLKFDANKVFE